MTHFSEAQSTQPKHFDWRLPLLFCLILIFGGCSTTEPLSEYKPTIEKEADHALLGPNVTVQELLDIATESTSPQREQLLLQASNKALRNQSELLAKRILGYITYDQIAYNLKAQYLAQLVRIALFERKANEALALFHEPTYALSTYYDNLPQTDQADLSRLRAQAFELSGNLIEAIMERVFLTQILYEPSDIFPAHLTQDIQDRISANNNAIWYNFQSLSLELFNQLNRQTLSQLNPNQILLGWIQLANIYNTHTDSISARLSEVEAWQMDWASHPASHFMPSNISALIAAAKFQPNQLALIIPQSGNLKRASDVFMTGFISGYYHSKSKQIKTPKITVFDSTQGDIADIYQDAVDQGADMIIGPLDKKLVDRLFEFESLPVPTLTLNYTTHTTEPPNNLYQFGLAAEDEVIQIADRAFLENHQYAMVLYPNTEWGKRVSQSFKHYWNTLEGVVSAEAAFKPGQNFSSLIKTALQIGDSETRASQIKKLLGDIEFKPRRRQDIDFVLVLGNPREARQIVPTLAFHYAHDLPVYATSNIYSGQPKPAADKDLNGVIFTDLPWVINEQDPIKTYLRTQTPNTPSTLTRLQAMGADAYRLHQQLAVITLGLDAVFNGSTGQLSLGEGSRIERKANWAIFKNGKATIDSSAPLLIRKPNEAISMTKDKIPDSTGQTLPSRTKR